MFVCPSAAGNWNIVPANDMPSVTSSNSSYNYFSTRDSSDGSKVIICDQNGPSSIAGPGGPVVFTNWGLNHCLNADPTATYDAKKPQGGNVVMVDGSGMWVATTNVLGETSYITNAIITNAFGGAGTNIMMF